MPQFTSEILNTFCAPELSKLTVCGAQELPEHPDYFAQAIWSHIAGLRYLDPALLHLSMTFLRRSMTATHEYRAARSDLLRYIDGLSHGNQRLLAYIAAVSHFEQCICAVYQAAQIHKKIEELLLPNDIIGENLFKSGDGSDLERINKIYNVIKHFSAQQATKQSAPVWITNYGLQSVDAIISFEELVDNIEALWEINRVTFIEIPNQKRQQGS